MAASPSAEDELASYVRTLTTEGQDPTRFVLRRLDEVDLILFDDAWHPVVEPFDFYQSLILDPEFRSKVDFLFVEAFSIHHQPIIDRFLGAALEDVTLLSPMLQDDFSGHGWTLETYVDLLRTVRRVNRQLPEAEKLEVVAVNDPSYWPLIKTPEDLRLHRKSLVGNDYGMYRNILAALESFESGKKGVFLTNTRHAYKGIRKTSGEFFWNAGTFFAQWHPGKTSSIRFHHLILIIRKEVAPDPAKPATTAGMERYDYSFERVAAGRWDEAFAAHGNRPVAFDLAGTPFGREAYAGNHMHRAAPGQTMADANDSIIFLAPVETLHSSARVDFIYTQEFKHELARRYRILYTEDQLRSMFEQAGVSSLAELIATHTAARPESLIPQTQDLPPASAWRSAARAEEPPPVAVFAALDGTWEGTFAGYDLEGRELYRIHARHSYRTVDGERQAAEIEDTLADGTVITGTGYNVARRRADGSLDLLCLIEKSNGERVEHRGAVGQAPDGTPQLVWHSRLPGRVEVFREVVRREGDGWVYTIDGYGRYGDSEVVMAGRYRKVR